MPCESGSARHGAQLATVRGIAAILLMACGLGLPVRAGEPAPCPDPAPLALKQDPQWILHGLEVLVDAPPDARPEQVLGSGLCTRFHAVPGPASFGYRTPAVWLRFGLPRLREPADWRLLILFGRLDRVCLHWPVEPAPQYHSECADHHQPMGEAGRTPQGWYFTVPATLDATRPVLLYTRGGPPVEVEMALGTADRFVGQLYLRQTWLGSFYGLMLGVVLLGLLMFAAQRDRTYLYFAGTVALFTLYIAMTLGHGSALGLVGPLANALLTPLTGVNVLLSTLFYQRFLETWKYTRRLHRSLLALALLYLILSLLEPLANSSLTVPLRIVLALAWLLVLLATQLLRLRQGSRAALHAVLAQLSFGLVGIMRALNVAGVVLLPPQALTLAYCVGQLLLALLLALGLLDRMRRLARERDQAKELALSSQQLALYRAHYDQVTRLPNRARFREDLQERLLRRGSGPGYALVTLGLDRFGLLNDALGHDIGDSVLGEIARRLQTQLGQETLIARVGADLFAWLAPLPADGTDVDAVRRQVAAVQEAVIAPLHLASGARLSASVGIALYPAHAGSAELLLQYSDAALHRAKLCGAGQLQVFDPASRLGAARGLDLGKALHRALERDELTLLYQPIVALQDGRVLGAEALVHWTAPDGLPLSPDHFLRLLQCADLLRPFTEWQFRRHGRQLADWQSRGVAVPYAALNLAAAQLRLPDLESLLLRLLDQSAAPPQSLVIEIAGLSLIDNLEPTRQLLQHLRQRGIGVTIDDFGAGQASAEYLRLAPADMLKLDGVFLRGVPEQAEATSVLDSLLQLGQSLQLKVLCNAVETEAQVHYLAAHGVTAGQGPFFSAALPPAELERWLAARLARAA